MNVETYSPNDEGVGEGCIITGDNNVVIAYEDDIITDGVTTVVLMAVTVTGSTTGHDKDLDTTTQIICNCGHPTTKHNTILYLHCFCSQRTEMQYMVEC